MLTHPSLMNTAVEVMQRKLRDDAARGQSPRLTASWDPTNRPAARLLPSLLAVVETQDAEHVHWLRPMIERMVIEQECYHENGDTVAEAAVSEIIDYEIDLLVRVLEEVRRYALRRGVWSTTPAPPLMCG